MGASSGSVTRKKTCRELAPSISAASNMFWSMPWMPAISRIVVLPNHIRKFIREMSTRTGIFRDRKSMALSAQPAESTTWLTGPTGENSVKNSMEKAEAMIRFGM